MSYTVTQVRAALPEVQFVGGAGIIRVENKAVEIGRVAAGGMFVPSEYGQGLLESANKSAGCESASEVAVEAEVEVERKPRNRKVKMDTEFTLDDI